MCNEFNWCEAKLPNLKLKTQPETSFRLFLDRYGIALLSLVPETVTKKNGSYKIMLPEGRSGANVIKPFTSVIYRFS